MDAILLTDNQFGQLHMSTLAASALLIQNDVDPIMQLGCRNKNRIALLSELFGAAALGVTSLLLVRGNKVPKEINPKPKAVLDVNATELISIAMTMKSDQQVGAFSKFFIGGSVIPHNPESGWVPEKLINKTSAGAQFKQMSICMARWLIENRTNVKIPDEIISRLEQATDPEQEGIKICTEILQQMAEIPGISGVNIMSGGNLNAIPTAIKAAHLNS